MKFQYWTDELERHVVNVVNTDGWEADAIISLRVAAQRFNYRRDDVAVINVSLDATARSKDALKKTLSALVAAIMVLIATIKVCSYRYNYVY